MISQALSGTVCRGLSGEESSAWKPVGFLSFTCHLVRPAAKLPMLSRQAGKLGGSQRDPKIRTEPSAIRLQSRRRG